MAHQQRCDVDKMPMPLISRLGGRVVREGGPTGGNAEHCQDGDSRVGVQVNQAVDTAITFAVRFANSYVGGEMWIAWARLVGLQGDKPDASDILNARLLNGPVYLGID